ncbi:GNAT family N-acetyltransferase [Metabacillus sp. B2-18]|uniref:GNAT family N-acetyltransferase n=1 Tax=Metabacillus sp. B2-18 TaxID=2897333 RepID=UPI001E316819|nr:GNAT family N-acetyltransferase [Metabacillus sp. B2-18]UGB32188.1 GNAT family N-acetyltransferase [Metabacillus sp. B2-18]
MSFKSEVIPVFAHSVINKLITGEIIEQNDSTLICTSSGIFVVSGESSIDFLNDTILPIYEIKKQKNERFTLFSTSLEWDELLTNKTINEFKQYKRYSYFFNKHRYSSLELKELKDGFELRRFKESTINKSNEFNEAYVKEYWGSTERFLQHGFGYFISYKDKIVSESISIFASENYAEIDVATSSNFSGMGLASHVSAAFIKHCLEYDKVPRWDCDIHNVGSINLAQKLGFENPRMYSIFVKR